MSTARLFLLLIGVGFLWFIVRQVIRHWLGGPDRKELLDAIDREDKLIEREVGGEVPACPLCGAVTKLYSYPHIKVWRCTNYPVCRGFTKAKKPTRMKFATEWDRRKGRKG